MRILISLSAFSVLAIALPAAACDMHGGGGGMFNQLSGASWQHYTPNDDADALTIEEQLVKWHAESEAKLEAPKPRKPSFASASNRAVIAAKARLAKKPESASAEKSRDADSSKADQAPPKKALR